MAYHKPLRFRSSRKRPHYYHSDSSDASKNYDKWTRRSRNDESSSKWTTETLVKYGIAYASDPITIDDFTENIQSRTHEVCEQKVPEFLSTLKTLSKKGLVFSLDVPEKETLKNVDKQSDDGYDTAKSLKLILNRFDAFVNNVLDKEEEIIHIRPQNKALFFAWSHHVRSFLNYYKKFLHKMDSSVTESMFTRLDRNAHLRELFMVFCKIFFLEPEFGDKEVKRIIIGTKVASFVPDIRFTCLSPLHRSVLMMLTEVKKTGTFKEIPSFEQRRRKPNESSSEPDQSSGNYIHRILDIHVLGQHGGQLLSELRSSAFAPRMVLGCICIGTEIIFTSMEMTGHHFDNIVHEGKCDGESSIIQYTKPLNYLLEEDRNKCMDLLFLLGFLQTSGYRDWYPNLKEGD